ncbi:ABC transporter ATP-binding protein [Aneurinibacillus aneurinilyticus]|uniref:ABC transporter, ATP-binding protein n=1 Tax=Aneurinibacillus aneurinilyticus ATCC 12856 TaxID=649747 RepID=U1WAT5_ANEAE|nr:ABC transporter ATP-binding protein [Aneurinibacillus aneurinilyticus]ERI05634.1 ABC transporter, ATP-binding protein [Aneurinibacillus aneurinilyticus ATCC 12856]MED0706260.1 ABC transporter ATP-binding protein [Aneurinibacillus aneurinilyticus]MED0724214.1 ABC transporter ATP-binding protein [Aneurinibacillus aneurinilyticus]MED0732258.1 ABC transporter ATP-binding protein [Aneurinibacillus aneurinilyticus]MED0741725.1 ABC transporter ATP-binding protein [Aneurinibacillus aneurinilyticus]
MIKLFRFLYPYRISITIVLALIFLQALSDLYLPTLMADIVDTGIVKGDIPYILRIGGFMLLIAAIGMICSISASFLSAKISAGFGKLIRNRVFTHVENFSLQEFDRLGTSSLITRTTNDITQVQQVVTMMLRMMISAPMMCIGGIIMAVSKDAKLSLVLVIVLPVIAAAIFAVVSKGMPLFKAMQVKLDKLNLVLREGLIGIRAIRSFNRIDHEKRRFDEANVDLTKTAVKVNRIMALLMPVMMLVLNFSSIAIIWFGSIRIDSGDMQVGSLMAFLQYAMQIMFSLIMVSMMFVMIPRASASAIRINEVLDMIPEIKDPVQIKHADSQRGCVEFRKVTFRYPGAEKCALTDISFSASPGEVTAIIGGTGSGKSTLISLIPRFYDIDSGSILVDGVDIRDMSQESLRGKIGFVPQKAVLFSGTVAENIRYGKEEATDQEIRHAAEVAQATEFITGLKDGFDSVIAQGGANVSGGQKQRLSIARALVRRAEIYIFDDSFSALDFKTDANLRMALKEEITDSIVFIVAQRVSTVMDADRIIVLDEGRIAGIGNHRELMDTCEVYQEIVFSQLSEEEIA